MLEDEEDFGDTTYTSIADAATRDSINSIVVVVAAAPPLY